MRSRTIVIAGVRSDLGPRFPGFDLLLVRQSNTERAAMLPSFAEQAAAHLAHESPSDGAFSALDAVICLETSRSEHRLIPLQPYPANLFLRNGSTEPSFSAPAAGNKTFAEKRSLRPCNEKEESDEKKTRIVGDLSLHHDVVGIWPDSAGRLGRRGK